MTGPGLNTAPGQKRTASKAAAKANPQYAAEASYMKHRTEGHTETTISGDTRADWSEAFELVPSLQIAYVWHASIFTREVLNGLLRIGFLYPQQIIWNKGRTVLTRTHYWYQHEPCWYVRKEERAVVREGRRELHDLGSPSPKFIMGGSDEEKFDHPTQKPVDLMRRPILNHTKRGELVYEPFLGSGTTLAAAELTERVCCGIELDPKYVDVVIQRWQTLSGKKATLDGDGRTFEEIAEERQKGQHESLAAARRSRTWNPSYSRAIQTFRDCAGRWWTGRRNCGCCKRARVGHRCATFGPRSLRRRPVGVSAKAAVTSSHWFVTAVLALRDQHRQAQISVGLERDRKSVVGGGLLVGTCHFVSLLAPRLITPKRREDQAESAGPTKKSPPRPEPGGPGRRRSMLLVDPVGALALVGFEGLDGVSGLLHRAGHEAANGVFLPAHLVHDLRQRGAVLPLEHGDHLGRLAALARPGGFLRLGGLLALGAFLAGVAFLVALAFAGAPLAACAPPLALGSAFGFGVSPRLWMRSQIRPAAALAFLKLFTGFTPGRLFQMATSRSAGHCPTRLKSSFWLAKVSNGVAVVAAASSGVANALMLFSASMVNVFM